MSDDGQVKASFPAIVGYIISSLNDVSEILTSAVPTPTTFETNKALTKIHETLKFIYDNLPAAVTQNGAPILLKDEGNNG